MLRHGYALFNPGRRVRSRRLGVAVCSIVFVLMGRDGTAAESKPGAPRSVVARGRAGQLSATFRYCPPGKLRPGMPKPRVPDHGGDGRARGANDPVAAALDDAVSISEFYISETEITIPQFRTMLGDDRLSEVVNRYAGLQSAANLKQMVQSGQDYPVYFVTLDDVLAFCEAMRAGYAPGAEDDSSGIVTYIFRIPTHNEWQYACRAVSDVESQERLPHFSGWPDGGIDALDRNTRSKCEEEWKALGKDLGELRGTQEQIVFIVENSKSGGTVPLEILSAFLKAGIGTTRNYADRKPGKVAVVAAPKPNAWGIFDMHDNVHEWVIAASADRADSLLGHGTNPANPLVEAPHERIFFLSGGSFSELMAGSTSGWKTFTIWGGKPSDPNGAPQPFSLEDEGPRHANTEEYDPGFRVIMRRSLSDAWLLAVRQDAVLAGSLAPDTLARLKAKRAAALEVANVSQTREIEARMTYYEGLVHYRMGHTAEGSAAIRAARKAIPSSGGGRASRLAAALGSDANSATETPRTPKVPSEEAVFLDALATLIDQET